MIAQKAPAASTAATSPPPPPKTTTAARNGKPQAPFAPLSRDTPPAEPVGAEPTDAVSLLAKWLGAAPTAGPSTTSAIPRALQPPSDTAGDAAKEHHGGELLADTTDVRPRPKAHGDDPLDPMMRQATQLGPPLSMPPLSTPNTPEAAVTARAMASLEELLPQLVRKIAWSGDGKRGSVRMELGAGALAGSTILLEADAGRLRVHLDTPPGVDGEAWKQRIGARLAEKHIDVESIDVQ
jgi:hypothetical protein